MEVCRTVGKEGSSWSKVFENSCTEAYPLLEKKGDYINPLIGVDRSVGKEGERFFQLQRVGDNHRSWKRTWDLRLGERTDDP